MTHLNQHFLWEQCQKQRRALANTKIIDLFAKDPQRMDTFACTWGPLILDFSKNLLTPESLASLCQLAESQQLDNKIKDLFSGQPLNTSENRPALHTALRIPKNGSHRWHDQDLMQSIFNARQKMLTFTEQVHAGHWCGVTGLAFTDVVILGIGGSYLGPNLALDALGEYKQSPLRFHFMPHLDKHALATLLESLNPATTLFILASKSFTTLETKCNASIAKSWLDQRLANHQGWRQQAIAITAKPHLAKEAGFSDECIFTMEDSVGGRYSLWSAMGLPIMLALGKDRFESLLQGAHDMDQHFLSAPFAKNMPVILSLLEIWYRNFWGAESHVIIPYSQKLSFLPTYLQQLVMESNGKGVTHQGTAVSINTAPIVWGDVGTACQHSFMQMLHQGTTLIPADFIAVADDQNPTLYANCLSQSRVLMEGKSYEQAYAECLDHGISPQQAKRLAQHKILPGNRPSNTLVLTNLSPYTLGGLLSLYEHKVFTTAVIYDINPFDQWGVEMSKSVARTLDSCLQNPSAQLNFDKSTNYLIQIYLQKNHAKK